jgi:hypothetical protein
MGDRLSGAIITAAVAAAAISTVVAKPITQTFAQTSAGSGAVPKTSWGEPDLQRICASVRLGARLALAGLAVRRPNSVNAGGAAA